LTKDNNYDIDSKSSKNNIQDIEESSMCAECKKEIIKHLRQLTGVKRGLEELIKKK